MKKQKSQRQESDIQKEGLDTQTKELLTTSESTHLVDDTRNKIDILIGKGRLRKALRLTKKKKLGSEMYYKIAIAYIEKGDFYKGFKIATKNNLTKKQYKDIFDIFIKKENAYFAEGIAKIGKLELSEEDQKKIKDLKDMPEPFQICY